MDVSVRFPSSDLASLDKVHRWRPCPPAEKALKNKQRGGALGTGVDTLMEMRTGLTAVPHAGLGYHFLRVQVDQTDSIDDHATG